MPCSYSWTAREINSLFECYLYLSTIKIIISKDFKHATRRVASDIRVSIYYRIASPFIYEQRGVTYKTLIG